MIEIVGLDDSGARMIEHPLHPADDARYNLKARRVVQRRNGSCALYRKCRPEPERRAQSAHDEHAKLIDAVSNFILEHSPMFGRTMRDLWEEGQRLGGGIRWPVCVIHSWTI